jgi:catechol 2,3-dioxygenase
MIKLLSHLSYVTITAPDVEASVEFYKNHVGLTEVGREDGSVYLRCWGDYYAYSVVVAPGDEPALATMAWRTSSAEALDEAAKRLEAAGVDVEWFDGHKIGRALRFVGPWGHSMTLHWDV